jgi:hypothetical protein
MTNIHPVILQQNQSSDAPQERENDAIEQAP